jgi:hypothetical protein
VKQKVALKKIALEQSEAAQRQYIYSSTEDSEVVFVFYCNNAGLKKLSSFV